MEEGRPIRTVQSRHHTAGRHRTDHTPARTTRREKPMVETSVPGTPSERPGIASLRDAPEAVDGLDADLRGAAATVARVPELLVACDYDGTVAPIVDDPTLAVPLPEAVAALRALASLPQTTVAVVSSRALRDLAALS